MADTPPQRRAKKPGRNPRQPKIKADEKAAVDKTARELADQVNGELAELKKQYVSRKYTPKQRRAANERRRKQLAKKRARENPGAPPPRCKGFTWKGTRCELPPLIPENWDGPNEPTGLYCVHHDPAITREETDAFILHGSANKPLPRKITPGELAHILVQRSPGALLEPYLKALGLEITEDGGLEKTRKGLRIHGFSRGGEVVRSPYEDLVAQVNVAEKLYDRVYGKPRQAVDLASQNTTVSVSVEMNVERVEQVVTVLGKAGALPVNGNGHQELEETVDGTVVEDEV